MATVGEPLLPGPDDDETSVELDEPMVNPTVVGPAAPAPPTLVLPTLASVTAMDNYEAEHAAMVESRAQSRQQEAVRLADEKDALDARFAAEPQEESLVSEKPTEEDTAKGASDIYAGLFKAALGGVRDGVVNQTQTLLDVGAAISEKLGGAGDTLDVDKMVPDVADAETTGQKLTEGGAKFATGFLPALGLFRQIGWSTQAMKFLRSGSGLLGVAGRTAAGGLEGMGAGVVADFSVWNYAEENLANLARENGFDYKIFQNLVIEPTDAAFTRRWKRVKEGIIVGGPLGAAASLGIEGALKAARAFRKATTAAALDTSPAALKPVAQAAQNVQFTRDHLAKTEELAAIVRPDPEISHSQTELMAMLGEVSPSAAREMRLFGESDLDVVLAEARAASQEAEEAFDVILREGAAPASTLTAFNDALTKLAPKSLEIDPAARAGIIAKRTTPVPDPLEEATTDALRAEVGLGPRVRTTEAPMPELNPLGMTQRQLDTFRERLVAGDHSGASASAVDIFSRSNLARMADEQGLRGVVQSVAQEAERAEHSAIMAGTRSHKKSKEMGEALARNDADLYGVDTGQIRAWAQSLAPEIKNVDALLSAMSHIQLGLDAKIQQFVDARLAGTATDLDLVDFERAAVAAVDFHGLRQGIVPEIARGLSSQRISHTADAAFGATAAILEKMGGEDGIDAAVKALHMARGDGKLTYHILKRMRAGKPKGGLFGRIVAESFVGGLFAGPATAAQNLTMVPYGMYVLGTDWLAGAVTGDRHLMDRVTRQFAGLFNGHMEAIIRTGMDAEAVEKTARAMADLDWPGARETVERATEELPFSALRAATTGNTGTRSATTVESFDAALSSKAFREDDGRIGKAFRKLTSNPSGHLSRFVDSLGVVSRMALRGLAAVDEISQGGNATAELVGQLFDEGRRQGLTGIDLDNFIQKGRDEAHRYADPRAPMTPDQRRQYKLMIDNAHKYAKKNSAVADFEPGSLGKIGQNVVNWSPWLRGAIPVYRSSANLMKLAVFDHTPLGLYSKGLQADLRAGKKGTYARMAIGTMAALYFMQQARAGKFIPSGPYKENERDAWGADGKTPGSFKHTNPDGSTYYTPLNFVEPFNSIIGTLALASADFMDLQGRSQATGARWYADGAWKLVSAWAGVFESRTAVHDFVNLAGIINNPDRFAARFAGGIIGNVTAPLAGFTRAMRKASDPTVTQSDKRSFSLRLQSEIDKAGGGNRIGNQAAMQFVAWVAEERRKVETGVEALDLFAKPQRHVTGMGPDILPIWMTDPSIPFDAVRNELSRLLPSELNNADLFDGFDAPGGQIRLSPTQINAYKTLVNSAEVFGEDMHTEIARLFESPDYAQAGDPEIDPVTGDFRGGKTEMLMDIVTGRRKVARGIMLETDKELSDLYYAKKKSEEDSLSAKTNEDLKDQQRQIDAQNMLTQGDPEQAGNLKKTLQLLGIGSN